MIMWDPGLYRTFASDRGRPFVDLVARIGADDPGLVVDLGCGSGELTAILASRWPTAEVRGIDSSAEMIAAAGTGTGTGTSTGTSTGTETGLLSFALGDVRTWQPDRPPDVIVCNAVLQWIPAHLDLLIRWAGLLAPGGWLAFQVPANFDQRAYRLLRDLMGSAPWRSRLAGVELNLQGGDPAGYLDPLTRADCDVDAWETTYLHVLHGADPIVTWYRSTGLRPVLAALDAASAERFLAEYGALLRAAYPAASYGTVFPFRRVFVVARRR
jgi:trans-aconitate 2-methyltransferase